MPAADPPRRRAKPVHTLLGRCVARAGPAALGAALKLPPFLEAKRAIIEARLPPLEVPA